MALIADANGAIDYPDDADSAVAAFTDRDRQTQALGALALAVGQAGDVERAMAIAGAIGDSFQRGIALCAVIEAVAANGAIGPAVVLAEAVTDAEARAAAPQSLRRPIPFSTAISVPNP